MSPETQAGSNARISQWMKKPTTSIGILLIVISIFPGTLLLIHAVATAKEKIVSEPPDILFYCTFAGLILSGVLFLLGRKFALYLLIITFVLITVRNLRKSPFDVFNFIFSSAIPILLIAGMIRYKITRHLK